MRNLAATWVPYLLADEQEKWRVWYLRQLRLDFEPNCPNRLCEMVIGVETWIKFYGIPSKLCNRVWVGPDGDHLAVLRPGF